MKVNLDYLGRLFTENELTEEERQLAEKLPAMRKEKGKLLCQRCNSTILEPQLCTPNLKTIQNPCLSLDPGWFLFSPNGCFLLDKKEFPLYGISVEKNTKRKET
ncbi:TPA: hypothetical protein ACHTCL_001976, partial [Streptococcus pneumoniae]